MKAGSHTLNQRGFSIVELMVASTISIIMFAVIIELFASNKEAYRLQEGASVLNENARYAISHLQYYTRLADHWGPVQPEDVNRLASDPPSVLCGGVEVISNRGFEGFDGTSAVPPVACVPAADYEPNTDMFFIRYGAGHRNNLPLAEVPDLKGVPSLPVITTATPPLTDAEVPVRATYFAGAEADGIWVSARLGLQAFIFKAEDHNDLPASNQHSASDSDNGIGTYFRYQAMLYYIRPCSNPATGTDSSACDAGDDGVPTLVRRRLSPGTTPTFDEEDIVSGVENMQLLYGVDTDADYIADRYDTAPNVTAAGDWDQVVSARISLIVANLERDNTINDTDTYFTLDDTWVPPPEARSFRRSQYEFTIQIRNMTRA